MTKLLKGHVSPETAAVVADYPYGFRARCKIRYWLEYKPRRGFRFCSQTTNPMKPGEVWNKPKLGVYCFGPVVLTRDSENGHVSNIGFALADRSAEQAQAGLNTYAEFLPVECLPEFRRFIRTRQEYEWEIAKGEDYRIAARQAMINVAREEVNAQKTAEVK